jgi:hypothetical protein
MKKLVILKLALASVLAAGALTACNEKQEVSFASLEEAKGTARENAMFNAQMYRQSNILYKGWDIIGRGDSTQSNACPQGDGWATMEFVNPEKTKLVKAKCSTVSGNTGCLDDADFKTKPFAAEDGVCAPLNRVPYPLPKIAK